MTSIIHKDIHLERKNIYFSRHAEYSSDILGVMNLDCSQKYPLTFQGIQQSYQLGQKLCTSFIENIFTSEYVRTQQTAYIINDHLDIPAKIFTNPLLNEFNPGLQFEGKSFKQYLFQNPSINSPLDPKGECFLDVFARVQNFLQDLQKNYSHYNNLIITHGYIIRMIQYMLGEISEEQAFKSLDFPKHCCLIQTQFISHNL